MICNDRSSSNSNKADLKSYQNFRYKTFRKIYEKLLNKMKIFPKNQNSKIHFDLINNKFMKRSKKKIAEVDKYLELLIIQNYKFQVFDQKSLKFLLLKKFLIFIILKKNILNFIFFFKSKFLLSLFVK